MTEFKIAPNRIVVSVGEAGKAMDPQLFVRRTFSRSIDQILETMRTIIATPGVLDGFDNEHSWSLVEEQQRDVDFERAVLRGDRRVLKAMLSRGGQVNG